MTGPGCHFTCLRCAVTRGLERTLLHAITFIFGFHSKTKKSICFILLLSINHKQLFNSSVNSIKQCCLLFNSTSSQNMAEPAAAEPMAAETMSTTTTMDATPPAPAEEPVVMRATSTAVPADGAMTEDVAGKHANERPVTMIIPSPGVDSPMAAMMPTIQSPPAVPASAFDVQAKVQKSGILSKRPFTSSGAKWQKR